MLKSPDAQAAARVVWKLNFCETALIVEASSIPNDTPEPEPLCVVPLLSVQVSRNVTPPVPTREQAVPVSMNVNWMWYSPATLQAPAAAAQRVAVVIATVCPV